MTQKRSRNQEQQGKRVDETKEKVNKIPTIKKRGRQTTTTTKTTKTKQDRHNNNNEVKNEYETKKVDETPTTKKG